MLRKVPFDPERPLRVRRPFDGYRIGDTFDASRVNFRRVAQLYNAAYIHHPDGLAAQLVAAQPEPVAEVDELPPVTEPEPEPIAEQPLVAEPAPASTVELVDTGAGWYNVMLAGVVLNEGGKLKGRKAAEAWCKEQGYM